MAFKIVCDCGATSIIEKTKDGYNWSTVEGDVVLKQSDDTTIECTKCKQTTDFLIEGD